MAEPVLNEEIEIVIAGVKYEVVPPSPSEIGINLEMILDESEILPRSHRVTPSTVIKRRGFRIFAFTGVEMISRVSAEAEAKLRRWLYRIPQSAIGLLFNTGGVDGDGEESHPATVLSLETEMMVNEFSGDGCHPPTGLPMLPEGGDGADDDPPLPILVDRFMRFRIYALIPAIAGTCIQVLAGMMEPTTENKKLIGVSMVSLIGNVVLTTWLIFRGGDLPNADWKNVSLRIMFVFTGELTFYASFATLTTNLFAFPGVVVCVVVAVGLGTTTA